MFTDGLPLLFGATASDPDTRPYAYLNYLIFDEQFNSLDAGAMRVPTTAGFDPGFELMPHQEVKFQPVAITTTGYMYVWVSNESEDTKVWFDDLAITQSQDIVTQATDYGVWGDVVREQKLDETLYRHGYQGQFAEKDEETSWQHFRRREYDPVIGRWISVDPKRQFYSSYLGMGNNPISGFDPDGGDVIILSAPQGAGGYGHAAMLVGNDRTGWKYISKDGTNGMGGAAGPPNQSTIDAVGSPTFATLQDFLGSRFNQDQDTPSASEYHFGLQIETDEATDAMIIASAKKGALQAYDVLSDNCMQNCTRPLVEQGLLPGSFGNMVRPNRTFDDILNHFIKNNNFDSQIFQGYHFWDNFHLIREQLPKGTIEVGPLEYKGVVKD